MSLEQEAREYFVQKMERAVEKLRNGPYPVTLDEAESKCFLTMLVEGGMVSNILDRLKTN